MFKNRNLLIISLVLTVNTLGYGIIIPVIFSYSQKYGLTVFQNGLLFALYSICQFFSTPLIGRASDKYGRRPLLVLSLAGTAASFFLMAFAPNAFFLFLARALDGITAGNIPVASAVISDTTKPQERAKAFGIISGAFNFGFIFGPLISALTVSRSASLPFIIAGLIATISVILTALFLPETNKFMGQIKKEKLFNFARLVHELFNEHIGGVFIITFLYATAFGMFIYAFQPFSLDVLKLTTSQISTVFVIFGVIGLVMQFFGIPLITKNFGVTKVLVNSYLLNALAFGLLFSVKGLLPFILVAIFLSIANAAISPLTQTVLSKASDETEQGEVQGLNTSYMSLGQILGPILGGAVAVLAISYPFLLAGLLVLICYFIARKAISFSD